jgi:hypothetical protein
MLLVRGEYEGVGVAATGKMLHDRGVSPLLLAVRRQQRHSRHNGKQLSTGTMSTGAGLKATWKYMVRCSALVWSGMEILLAVELESPPNLQVRVTRHYVLLHFCLSPLSPVPCVSPLLLISLIRMKTGVK